MPTAMRLAVLIELEKLLDTEGCIVFVFKGDQFKKS